MGNCLAVQSDQSWATAYQRSQLGADGSMMGFGPRRGETDDGTTTS